MRFSSWWSRTTACSGRRASRQSWLGGQSTASQDFRDPKVFRAADGGYRMILGSAVEGDPAVLLFASPDARDWAFHSVLYRAPAHFSAHGAGRGRMP